MKVAIVHDSQAGNGEKLATAMKEGFEAAGATVIVGHVEKLDPKEVADANPDLLVVGAAIRAFHTSPSSKKWLSGLDRALKDSGKTVGHAAAFVTHGLPKDKANGWGKRFRRKVEKVPGVQAVYADWLSGKVMGQTGPLEDGAEEAFRAHADTLLGWAGLK
jgi:flavodoxin